MQQPWFSQRQNAYKDMPESQSVVKTQECALRESWADFNVREVLVTTLRLSLLQERWENNLTDVFCNSDLKIRIAVLSSILQAMTSEPTSIQQSWFVSERQWVTVGRK
jgi:hypothetical protein